MSSTYQNIKKESINPKFSTSSFRTEKERKKITLPNKPHNFCLVFLLFRHSSRHYVPSLCLVIHRDIMCHPFVSSFIETLCAIPLSRHSSRHYVPSLCLVIHRDIMCHPFVSSFIETLCAIPTNQKSRWLIYHPHVSFPCLLVSFMFSLLL